MCDGMCEALTSDHSVTIGFHWKGRGSKHLQTYEHRGHYESKSRTDKVNLELALEVPLVKVLMI